MFQRILLRQAQAARSVASIRTTSAPLALRRTSQLPQSFRPLVRQPNFRSYSTENQAEEKKEGESKEATEDPVQKELEEKKKEVTDLKVRPVPDIGARRRTIAH